MFDQRSPVLRRPGPTLLAAFIGAFALGCFGDDFDEGEGTRPGPGQVRLDGGAADATEEAGESAECPSSQPKEGETCPGVSEVSITCSYVLRQCTHNGTTYDVVISLSCTRGGIWLPAGIADPCPAEPDPQPGDPDAAAEMGTSDTDAAAPGQDS